MKAIVAVEEGDSAALTGSTRDAARPHDHVRAQVQIELVATVAAATVTAVGGDGRGG